MVIFAAEVHIFESFRCIYFWEPEEHTFESYRCIYFWSQRCVQIFESQRSIAFIAKVAYLLGAIGVHPRQPEVHTLVPKVLTLKARGA